MINVISFEYSGDDEGDFLEIAYLTAAEAATIMAMLAGAVRRGVIKPGFYVGPQQETPSSFGHLHDELKEALK